MSTTVKLPEPKTGKGFGKRATKDPPKAWPPPPPPPTVPPPKK